MVLFQNSSSCLLKIRVAAFSTMSRLRPVEVSAHSDHDVAIATPVTVSAEIVQENASPDRWMDQTSQSVQTDINSVSSPDRIDPINSEHAMDLLSEFGRNNPRISDPRSILAMVRSDHGEVSKEAALFSSKWKKIHDANVSDENLTLKFFNTKSDDVYSDVPSFKNININHPEVSSSLNRAISDISYDQSGVDALSSSYKDALIQVIGFSQSDLSIDYNDKIKAGLIDIVSRGISSDSVSNCMNLLTYGSVGFPQCDMITPLIARHVHDVFSNSHPTIPRVLASRIDTHWHLIQYVNPFFYIEMVMSISNKTARYAAIGTLACVSGSAAVTCAPFLYSCTTSIITKTFVTSHMASPLGKLMVSSTIRSLSGTISENSPDPMKLLMLTNLWIN